MVMNTQLKIYSNWQEKIISFWSCCKNYFYSSIVSVVLIMLYKLQKL